jgi:hypothetical protein
LLVLHSTYQHTFTLVLQPKYAQLSRKKLGTIKSIIAIEKIIVDPGFVNTLAQYQKLLIPKVFTATSLSAHEQRLLNIHKQRLKIMDEERVEYMLLSLTSPGYSTKENPTFESPSRNFEMQITTSRNKSAGTRQN